MLAASVAACSSGLSSDQWLWCKQHLASVDDSAETLGVAKVQTMVSEPSWWADYVTSTQNSNNALIAANPAYIAACDDAATSHAIGESRTSWCLADGLADALGLIRRARVHVDHGGRNVRLQGATARPAPRQSRFRPRLSSCVRVLDRLVQAACACSSARGFVPSTRRAPARSGTAARQWDRRTSSGGSACRRGTRWSTRQSGRRRSGRPCHRRAGCRHSAHRGPR